MQLIPAKKLVEVLLQPFDFVGVLPVGVTISSADVVCTVISGTDPTPSAVVGTPVVSGSIVNIPLPAEGVEGVIYNISVRATGSNAKIYELNGPLAIIP